MTGDGSLPPLWQTHLLASVWPSLHCCEHLGGAPMDGRCSSISVFQIHLLNLERGGLVDFERKSCTLSPELVTRWGPAEDAEAGGDVRGTL